jgi:hypothetical protein
MTLTWQESYKMLLDGDYDHGWPDHEIIPVQNKNGTVAASTYGLPIWCGQIEPITLLVNAEFGDGDAIQYFRFVKLAQSRVKKVILKCNDEFRELFADVEVSDTQAPIPKADKIIHMMALPKVLQVKKQDINGQPYLFPNLSNPPCTNLDKLKSLSIPKFGINWAGNPFNPRDSIRSISVDLFSKLEIGGIKFFGLNKLFAPPSSYFDCREFMSNWNQTAHLIKSLDLVITVETSIACLAGALGVPVWVLIPSQDPEYRWGLNGENTFWYDSMRLYRKKNTWEETIDWVLDDLKMHLAQF